MLHRFRAKMQNPVAWAIQVLQLTAKLPPAERSDGWRRALELSNPAQRRSLFYYVQLLSGNGPEETRIPDLPELSEQTLEEFLGDLQKTDLAIDAYYSRNSAMREQFAALTDRYIQLGSIDDPLVEAEKLLHDVRAERQRWGERDERLELVELETKVLGQLALVNKQRSDYGEALRWYVTEAELARRHGMEERWLEVLVSRAEIHQRGGREAAEALRLILPLWEEQREDTLHLPAAELTLLLADTYFNAGDTYEARKYAGTARRQLGELELEHDAGTALVATTDHWIEQLAPRFEVPEDFMAELLKALMLNLQLERLEAKLNGGDEEVPTKEYTRVIEKLWEAVREQETEDHAAILSFSSGDGFSQTPRENAAIDTGPPPAVLYWEAGEQAAEAGDYTLAHQHFEAAYKLGQESEDDDISLHSLSLLMVHRPAADVAGSLKAALRAIRQVEAVRAELRTPYQQSAYMANKEMFYGVAMISAWKLNQTDALLRTGELLKGHPVEYGGSPESRATVNEELRSLSDRAGEDPSSLESRQRRYDRFMLDQPTPPDRWEAMPEDFAGAIRRRLPTDAAVVNYTNLANQVLLITVLTREKQLVIRQVTDSAAQFDQLAHRELFASDFSSPLLRSPRYVPGTDESPREVIDWDSLTDWLLPPEAYALISKKKQLYVCPHRQLHRVPFHALRIGGDYLLTRHVVSYVPNLSVLLTERPVWELTGVSAIASAFYLPHAGVDLPPIPGTELEVKQITEAYRKQGLPQELLSGSDCTRTKFLDLLDAFEQSDLPSVLHLAVHGEDAPGDVPLDTRLFLHRGTTDGFDLLLRNLPFPLVVLSSCFAGNRPGAGRELPYLPADDLFGFQAAFFAAGAHRVLGALWAVDDRAGTELMTEFHRQLLRGEEPATALALSQRHYLATAPEVQRHPRYWAPFFLSESR